MLRSGYQSSAWTSFLVAAFGLLCVGVPFYLIVVSRGWAGLSAMPYAIPIAALAVAVIVAVGHRLTAPRGYAAPVAGSMTAPRGSRRGGVFAGLILVGAGMFMSFSAGADARRYANDRGCAAGFGVAGFGAVQAGGACRLERVRIVSTYACGRHNSSSCLMLEASDGSRSSVVAATNFRGSVYAGAQSGNDRSARAQYFDGRVVQLETASGRISTTDMPLERERFWTLMGLVGGVFGMVAAVVTLLRGAF